MADRGNSRTVATKAGDASAGSARPPPSHAKPEAADRAALQRALGNRAMGQLVETAALPGIIDPDGPRALRTAALLRRLGADLGLHAGDVEIRADAEAARRKHSCACGGSASLGGSCESCQAARSSGKPLQAKLNINAPGDQFEQEADRVAEQVLRMPDRVAGEAKPSSPAPELVQRRVGSGGAGIAQAPPVVDEVLSSPGQPLDPATRAFFEPRFGHDFGRVRIHADAEAARSAQAINALAYTVGSDIVFGNPRSSPDSSDGRDLLAHELSHVVQQADWAGAAPPPLQRQAGPESQDSSAQTVDDDLLSQASDFLSSFEEFRDLASSYETSDSSVESRLRVALALFDERWRSMDYHDAFGASAFYGLFSMAQEALALFELRVSELESLSDTADLSDIRNGLDRLGRQLSALQGAGSMRGQAQRTELAREARAAEALALEHTPEGRQSTALTHLRTYVQDHPPNTGKAGVSVYANQLGRYLVHEQNLSGSEIQAVLETIKADDPDLFDRALYQGELLVYLLEEGVTGLDVESLLSDSGSESEGAPAHVSGAGFYAGFDIWWLDQSQKDPLDLPTLRLPRPDEIDDVLKGFYWGLGAGFLGTFADAAKDILSALNPTTWLAMYKLVSEQLPDERWQFELGRTTALAFHAYLKDVADDSLKAAITRFGRVIGAALAEVAMTFLGAKFVALAAKAARATKWGAPLFKFADRVGDALPWRDPRVVENDVAPDSVPDETPVKKAGESSSTTTSSEVPSSFELSNELVTPSQSLQEAAYIDAHPELIDVTSPQKRAKVGDHEIVEMRDGGCSRNSPTRKSVPCPVSFEAPPGSVTVKADELLSEDARGLLKDRSVDPTPSTQAELDASLERTRSSDAVAPAKTTDQKRLEREALSRGRIADLERQIENLTRLRNESVDQLARFREVRAEILRAQREGRAYEMPADVLAMDIETPAEVNAHILGLGSEIKLHSKSMAAPQQELRIEIRASSGMTTELVKLLRSKTPSDAALSLVKSRSGGRDEAFGSGLLRAASADHIVPFTEIIEMDDFGALELHEQIEVLNNADNLQYMSDLANSSKGNKRWQEWDSSAYETANTRKDLRKEMIRREGELRQAIQDDISARVARRRGQVN